MGNCCNKENQEHNIGKGQLTITPDGYDPQPQQVKAVNAPPRSTPSQPKSNWQKISDASLPKNLSNDMQGFSTELKNKLKSI